MSLPTVVFLAALVVVNIAFLIGWLRARRTHPLRDKATAGDIAIGLVTDFFDALVSVPSPQPPRFSSCADGPRMSSFRHVECWSQRLCIR